MLAVALSQAQFFCAIPASHAAIGVDKPQVFYRPGGAYTRVRLHITPNDGSADEMSCVIIADGALTLSMYNESVEYYENKSRTLVAFNIKGNDAKKGNEIYLVAQGRGGQILVIKDFDHRVGQLCARNNDKEFFEYSAVADRIVGDRVYLSTVAADDADAAYFVAVRVSPDGQLSLLSHKLKKSVF